MKTTTKQKETLIDTLEFTGIPKSKQELARCIMKYIELMKESDNLPVTLRNLHYYCISNKPLHTSKKGILNYYGQDKTLSKNGDLIVDPKYYKALSDTLTSMRLLGYVNFAYITDKNREWVRWSTYYNVNEYFQSKIEKLKNAYSRDLLQSQENFIVVISEKTSFETTIERLCSYYCIPYQLGGGMSSISIRYELVKMFKASGKDKLILLYLNDLDISGENISNAYVNSLKSDFGFTNESLVFKKVLLTPKQVTEYGLQDKFYKRSKDTFINSLNKTWLEHTGLNYEYELDSIGDPSVVRDLLDMAIRDSLNFSEFRKQQCIQMDEKEALTEKVNNLFYA